MASPRQFSRNIRRLAQRLEAGVEQRVRRTALAIDQAVVLGTPVDVGRARSNWQVTLDAPAEGTRDAFVPGEGGATGAANARAAIAEGQQVIASYRIGQNRTIHITNNLPYIQALNDGSSAQAPAGFVEEAVQAGTITAAARGRRILDRGN